MKKLVKKMGKKIRGRDLDVCDICMQPLEGGKDAFCYTESEYFYMLHAEGMKDSEIWEKLKDERNQYLKLCDTCHTSFKFLMRSKNLSMEEALAELCLVYESDRHGEFQGSHFVAAFKSAEEKLDVG